MFGVICNIYFPVAVSRYTSSISTGLEARMEADEILSSFIFWLELFHDWSFTRKWWTRKQNRWTQKPNGLIIGLWSFCQFTSRMLFNIRNLNFPFGSVSRHWHKQSRLKFKINPYEVSRKDCIISSWLTANLSSPQNQLRGTGNEQLWLSWNKYMTGCFSLVRNVSWRHPNQVLLWVCSV